MSSWPEKVKMGLKRASDLGQSKDRTHPEDPATKQAINFFGVSFAYLILGNVGCNSLDRTVGFLPFPRYNVHVGVPQL
jgi:hypothetical protein